MSPNSCQFWNFFRPKMPTFPGSRMDKQNISLNSILHCPRRSKGVGVRGWQSSKSDRQGSMWPALTNQRPALRSRDSSRPIRGRVWPVCLLIGAELEYLAPIGHVTSLLAVNFLCPCLSCLKESCREHFTSQQVVWMIVTILINL